MMQRIRDYYARRNALVDSRASDEALRSAVRLAVGTLEREGFFQLHLGYECVDAGFVSGTVGDDVATYSFYTTGVRFWPLSQYIADLEEAELFTAIEFLHDHASAPKESRFHSFADCGLHVESGDDDAGRAEFRERLNPLLARCEPAYVLSDQGEIWTLAPFDIPLVPGELGDSAVDDRVASAISSFRKHGATESDRRQAVRELADVLEYLRSTVGTQLPRWDEDRLFEIANEYAIRHHNPTQKTDYDNDIWFTWFFHAYVNAIDLAVKLLERKGEYEVSRCPACHQRTLESDSWAEREADGGMSGGNFMACSNCSWTSL